MVLETPVPSFPNLYIVRTSTPNSMRLCKKTLVDPDMKEKWLKKMVIYRDWQPSALSDTVAGNLYRREQGVLSRRGRRAEARRPSTAAGEERVLPLRG